MGGGLVVALLPFLVLQCCCHDVVREGWCYGLGIVGGVLVFMALLMVLPLS